MIRETSKAESKSQPDRVELAIEEYLNERGTLNTEEWLGRYPDCTLELLEFLGNHSHFAAIATAVSCSPKVKDCRIGDYEILEVLDRGGMGIVYKARQKNLRRIVALKMIQQAQFQSPEVRRRFQNEAETAARLRHPNLVAIHEVGQHNGIPYFSMEYVKGRTLADLSRQGRIRPRVVAQISQTIAETIHYIHGCGVLHRDLKPSNVMIDHNCDVRITDFGLAKQLDRDYSLTETGQILGSIDYMPPEQAEARHEKMGAASDVYSIGAILYELLAGRPPFRSGSFLETLRQIREEIPTPISRFNPRVPRALEAICLKCLEKKASKRYRTARHLAVELQRFLDDEPVEAEKRGLLSNLLRSRSRWLYTAASVVGTAVVAGICCCATVGNGSNISTVTTTAAVAGPETESTALSTSENLVNASKLPEAKPHSGNETSIATTADVPDNNDSLIGRVGRNIRTPEHEKQVAEAEDSEVANRERMIQRLADPAGLAAEHDLPILKAIGISGEPFGIAHLELEVAADCKWTWQPDKPLRLISENGIKALYTSSSWVSSRPATENQPARKGRLRIWCVYDGMHAPSVTIVSGDEILARNVEFKTVDVNENRTELVNNWLSHFSRPAVAALSPEMASVRQYFDEMLARRMGLSPSLRNSVRRTSGLEVEFERTFGMLFGFESVRLAMMSDKIPSSDEVLEAASETLPASLSLPSVRVAPTARKPNIRIESIAGRVPEECFYLRCFRLSNYLWVRSLVKGWGGDIDGVVATPAADYGIRDRIESQLALNVESLLASGIDKGLTDCALIGLDPFFGDGAAVGVIFEEKRSANTGRILDRCRDEAARAASISESTLRIGANSVRLLQNHNKQIRSFYVVSDRYHLITNSQAIVQRFLQTETEQSSIAGLSEYLHARSEVQHEGVSAAWLYLSDPFFRNITSATYRIELQRRRRAKKDLLTLQLARMASEAETGVALDINELIRDGYLPSHFDVRPDNSKPTVSEGVVCDSVRGAAGTFVPISDMEFSKCTNFERSCYEKFKSAYQLEWRSVDPVLLTFGRMPRSTPGRENVVLKIHITPYAQQEYAFLRQHLNLPPDAGRLASGQSEILGVTARIRSGQYTPWVAAGLLDEEIPFELTDGKVLRTGRNRHQLFSASNAYALVTSPDEESALVLADFVSCLKSRQPLSSPGNTTPRTAFEKIVESLFPVQQWIRDRIKANSTVGKNARVLSADRIVGKKILDDYQINEANREAHMSMHLGDVSKCQVYPYIRAWTFMSSRQASAADASSVNFLADALQASPERVLRQIESSIGAELRCPIGGTYLPKPTAGRPPFIVSTGWKRAHLHEEKSVPEDYDFPFLRWLRGLNLECRLGAVTLESRLELDIEAPDCDSFQPIPDLAAK